jgi:magnesium-transporting ATPase (P-type)
MFVCGIK